MKDLSQVIDFLKEKGVEFYEQTKHLPKKDLDRIKRSLANYALNFINQRRNPDKLNPELLKKLCFKRWLKNILEFPYQEKVDSTLVVMGASDYRFLLGLGLNTTYFLSLDGGGIMASPACPLIKSELPPRYKESFFLSEQILQILKHNTQIDKIFLVSSFPFPPSLTTDTFWNIKHATVWLAEAQEYLVKILKNVEVCSFLLYKDELYQIISEKVIREKNKEKM